ncbi:MAG: hypothetical protein DI587_35910 [Variovorax paradoxus]|nr:MAG: hypothetical protein DI583_35910 [Variovorax paradoxus]PZQ01095.1 MAG: hypothetical protein DI587_35910 [Variovorax paradoxus]
MALKMRSRPLGSVVGRTAVAWMRWMLVLLLVVDQVSAPWHRHHHESGIDDVVRVVGAMHASDVHGVHLDEGELHEDFAHATAALRAEVRLVVLDEDRAAADPAWLVPTVHPWVDPPLPPAAQGMTQARASPDKPAPRSLPPDGRAPPLTA